MNSIVILVARTGVWSPVGWAEAAGGKRVGDRQVTIERGRTWLSIVRDDQVLDDFDESERARLGELVGDPAAYLVEWNDGALVESLLRAIPRTTCAAVDNDHGLLVPVHQVADKPLDSWVKVASLP